MMATMLSRLRSISSVTHPFLENPVSTSKTYSFVLRLRGLGLGREIFTFLARRASEHGCGRMEWSVLNWNESAIAFYRKLGAVPVRQWTVFHLAKEELDELAKP